MFARIHSAEGHQDINGGYLRACNITSNSLFSCFGEGNPKCDES